jgi:hypothetical protein
MKQETKFYVDLSGDQAISKPSKKIEVAGEKEAALEAIAYGSRRFSLSSTDLITMADGKTFESQSVHVCSGILVMEVPRKRDDAISWYQQKLANAFAQAAGASTFETKQLQGSIDYLQAEEPNSYFVCESISVGMPERHSAKYFDYSGNLLLDLKI